MIFAIDFDGTIVSQQHAYNDLESPLRFLPGARDTLLSLKRAGHTLLLYSARANKALRIDWRLNPLWSNGTIKVDEIGWQASRELNEARYQQMIQFVNTQLPGVFSAIDDGEQGKPTGVDFFIDDRNLDFITLGWEEIKIRHGR